MQTTYQNNYVKFYLKTFLSVIENEPVDVLLLHLIF